MKILIISSSFPPQNVIGAVRSGKLAKYLHERGYDVRVLAAPPTGDTSLPLEIPADQVVCAKDWNIDGLFDPLVEFFRNPLRKHPKQAREPTATDKPSSATSDGRSLKERIKEHYYALLRIPDARAGWRKNAILAGRELLSRWRPDVIFASAPPVTNLFVGASLGRRFHVPWIAELRDLWVDNPYYLFPAWRKRLDQMLERRVLGQAASLVTVTPLWGQTLEKSWDKPVSVILNGYAEEDHPIAAASAPKQPGKLSILYTGNIYPGFRDPSALFEGIRRLTAPQRLALDVEFYGSTVARVQDLVSNHEVTDCVRIHRSVTYRQSLELQRNADVLLLLQWNDPRDAGNIPAKFFEYIATGRPILFLGYEQGTLANLIREREAGFISNSPEAIAAKLASWIDIRQRGEIPALAADAKAGLSRTDQFQKLESVLMSATTTFR
jgi:glycosyltransferase involved in cell wall biosynthesis